MSIIVIYVYFEGKCKVFYKSQKWVVYSIICPIPKDAYISIWPEFGNTQSISDNTESGKQPTIFNLFIKLFIVYNVWNSTGFLKKFHFSG